MKLPQFSLLTILLVTAFAAICCGGIGITAKWFAAELWNGPVWELAGTTFVYGSCWIPFVFAAYALGKRKLTWQIVGLFAIAELAAVGFLYWKLNS